MRESFDSGGETRFVDHDSGEGSIAVGYSKEAIIGILL
jgi:hypothetical protein